MGILSEDSKRECEYCEEAKEAKEAKEAEVTFHLACRCVELLPVMS